MSLRFEGYVEVGRLTLTPDDLTEVVGNFSLGEGHDTLWIRVTQLNAPGPWPWSYGILGWRTSQGYELGSTKCYGEQFGETYRLSVGKSPEVRDGVITFEPRSFNLGWVRNGYPWSLKFEASSGQQFSGQTPGDPVFGSRATLWSPADFDDTRVSFSIDEGVAKIALS